jgi:nucleoside-diphosphate-sugar epimerase
MNVLIMGLGHLAGYFVDELGSEYNVWGTHRSPSTNSIFDSLHKIEFHAGESFSNFPKHFDVIVWNFPPLENYKNVLADADEFFENDIPWVFVSSTSVFGEGEITESSPRKQCLLTSLEDQLKAMGRKVSIIRPGGLVDSKRHPGNFFKNRDKASGANTPVNLVHTQDVARFIHHLLDKGLWGEDYNLVSSQHMPKSQFYSLMMQLKSTPVPEWDDQGSLDRIVGNQKSCESGFSYEFDDLVAYFQELSK